MRSTALTGWRRTTISLLAFGISFGYVEAAIVDYLGVLYEPARQRFYPGRSPDDVFPLLTLDQIRTLAPEQQNLIGVEVAREVATIVMLAAFAIVFGVWDISFYLCLMLLLDWPASVLTWDLLFLVPVPWAAPVLALVLVSASMIAAGFIYLRGEWAGAPVRIGLLQWLGIFLGPP